MSDSTIRILCFGDVVGRPGRSALKQRLADLRKSHSADLVIANGENAAGGTSPDADTSEELFGSGVDLITLGDHVWQKRDFRDYLEQKSERVIRPANYPDDAPGRGWLKYKIGEVQIGVMNLIGRVFVGALVDCPFKKADAILAGPLKDCVVIVCDMHAEATSEKVAMGRYLDGRASLVFGTHTHVQTADSRVLQGGTGYITDLGMCGALESVIGMDSDTAIKRFTTGQPHSYKVAGGDAILCGVAAEVSTKTGKAVRIERIFEEVKF